jgi:putative oxidoreductase
MKLQQTVYWITTGIFSLWMILNAYAYLFSEQASVLCAHFGFPDYFRIELGIAKFLGVILLLLPIVNARIKEWAYVGFGITMISGFIAHLSSGDSFLSALSALLALHLLLASYYSRIRSVNKLIKRIS